MKNTDIKNVNHGTQEALTLKKRRITTMVLTNEGKQIIPGEGGREEAIKAIRCALRK